MEHDGVDVGSYILVKYETQRKTYKYYIGRVDLKEDDSLTVSFMRNAKEASAKPSFCFPVEADTDTVQLNDVILILGQPENVCGTKRSAS